MERPNDVVVVTHFEGEKALHAPQTMSGRSAMVGTGGSPVRAPPPGPFADPDARAARPYLQTRTEPGVPASPPVKLRHSRRKGRLAVAASDYDSLDAPTLSNGLGSAGWKDG